MSWAVKSGSLVFSTDKIKESEALRFRLFYFKKVELTSERSSSPPHLR